MSSNTLHLNNCVNQLNNIDVEDLQYVERDLSFYELVSLGFLLYGEDRSNAEFVLQKLLILANTAQNTELANTGVVGADFLLKYATINPQNWRAQLIEALAIIGARRVLRKLGFQWNEVRQHYLPHIAEISLHVHPMLKGLYKMCERLTPAQAGRLILEINEQHKRPEDHLRFYSSDYLEVFLLDWITCRIISVGERTNMVGANVQVLVDYFKLHEMDSHKTLLVDTMKSNLALSENDADNRQTDLAKDTSSEKSSAYTDVDNANAQGTVDVELTKLSLDTPETNRRMCELEHYECYVVRREQAGIVLIINQKNFFEAPEDELKPLLPKIPLRERRGTDIDKLKLKQVFSSFGYKPLEYDDLTHLELLRCIREAVKRSLLYDSLIVCILSHGIDGAVYGSNSVPVEIAEIDQIITAEALQGKPKMLIVQACQKDDDVTSAMEKRKTPMATNLAADAFVDMIKAMSTVPGFASMRHTHTGSWFIQSLCNAVHEFGDRKHMLDTLIAVARDVTQKRGDQNEIMVPLTSHTLTKYFFLPRRQ